MPIRIQQSRKRGWRMPPGAIYVGRPTMWGNPFKGPGAAAKFRDWLAGRITVDQFRKVSRAPYYLHLDRKLILNNLHMLSGHDLCCWCRPDEECHADILLELANRPGISRPKKLSS